MKLFCLPHAGGSASRLVRVLGPHLGLPAVPVEPAGRGERWREPGYRDWPQAIDDLAGRVAGQVDGEYALFGHSVGALLAYEVAQRLARQGGPHPVLLAVGGRNPPHAPPSALSGAAAELPDEQLFAALVAIGGASPRAAGPLTYRTFLPGLRSDLRLAARYVATIRPPLACPVLALYGTADPLTSAARMAQWRRYTARRFELRAVRGGDHFFMLNRAPEVAALIRARLSDPPASVIGSTAS